MSENRFSGKTYFIQFFPVFLGTRDADGAARRSHRLSAADEAVGAEFGRRGCPDPEDHPEVEEDEEEQGEGARRADVLPVTAELDVGRILQWRKHSTSALRNL